MPDPLPHLLPGARTAIHTCMAVTPQDRVLIIGDRHTASVDIALESVAREATASTLLLFIEDYVTRPATAVPEAMRAAIEDFRPTVSLFAASAQPGELPFRTALTMLGRQFNVRHGHMVGIDEQVMQQGMTADYRLIAALTHRLTGLLRNARRVHITNPKGTDLWVYLDNRYSWRACHGLYHHPGDWGNLPEGETFTCPASAEGVVVAEVLGDYFSEKYGLLPAPLSFTIADGRLHEVTGENRALAEEVWSYLSLADNGVRLGEFAIGTNIALEAPVGNLLQDEKLPGIHIAFGSPLPHLTGADWSSPVHVDVIPLQCTITVDDRSIMRDGVFAAELLQDLL
ncbi:MAG: hypothetical protein D6775_05520 [Caldilineae bacterium]|nr:MAG: hypothetical protein D6775_05520 [Caldilineae bacterium]